MAPRNASERIMAVTAMNNIYAKNIPGLVGIINIYAKKYIGAPPDIFFIYVDPVTKSGRAMIPLSTAHPSVCRVGTGEEFPCVA